MLGAGPAGAAAATFWPGRITFSAATVAGRRDGMRISALRIRTLPPTSIAPCAWPRMVRLASRLICRLSDVIGRALLAVIVRSSGMPGAANSIVPLAAIVPGPARPVSETIRTVSPSPRITAAMSWMRMP